MTTGMKKIVTIGTVLAALVLSAPAYAKLALPDGYQLPSSEPTVYSPQALKALGERAQAMAVYYGTTTFASLPDAHQRQLETIASLNAGTGVTRADDFAPPKTGPSLVAGDDSVVDWNQVGIGIGIALLLAGLGGAALTLRTRDRVAHP
jgi:hypothetical protein